MYAQTKFEIIDQSLIPKLPEERNPIENLFLCTATTDKGPEAMAVYNSAAEFRKLFGEISFSRHGQALLQADRILQYGGSILFKRLVASDAHLANAIVVAKTKTEEKQKTNEKGQNLYIDNKTKQETTEVNDEDSQSNQAIMYNETVIGYEIKSVANAKNINDIIAGVETVVGSNPNSEGFKLFPIMIIADSGRGNSMKKFRISPNYNVTGGVDFTRYTLSVIEGTSEIATYTFGANPDVTFYGEPFSIEAVVNSSKSEITTKVLDAGMFAFEKEIRTNLPSTSGITDMFKHDILFGRTLTNKEIFGLKFDATSANLTSIYGIDLSNGSNGSFTDIPMANETTKGKVADEMVKFFDGDLDDSIFDLLRYQIGACLDANYPDKVKRSIEALAEFRQDFLFFEDMGFIDSIPAIKFNYDKVAKSNFVVPYCQSFVANDPFTSKKIPVTMTYALARILPRHFRLYPDNPMAGIKFDFIIGEAHPNTISFVPKVTPKMDQKKILDDLRINYASYIKEDLVVESQYTSAEVYTQLSFASNVYQLQKLIKDIRVRCPAIRYSFIEGSDFDEYEQEVKDIIARHTLTFAQISFEYIGNAVTEMNKIFYAAIVLRHADYAQSEWFKIYDISKVNA